MFGLTTTRRLRAEVAAVKAETARQRDRADAAEKCASTAVFNRGQVLAQNADLDASLKRLHGRNTELRRRLDSVHDADAERLQARVARLLKVAGRLAAALRQAQAVQAAPVSEADRQAIARWELRVKAHDAWVPAADREKRPIDGASGRPLHPAVALLRAMDRCRALEQKLADVEGRKRGVVL